MQRRNTNNSTDRPRRLSSEVSSRDIDETHDCGKSHSWWGFAPPTMPKPESLGRLTTMEELEMMALNNSESDLQLKEADGDSVDLDGFCGNTDDRSESSSMSSEDDFFMDLKPTIFHHTDESEQQDEEILVVPDQVMGNKSFSIVRFSHRKRRILEEVNVEEYMAKREMTATQERLNAITMIPSPLYLVYYILSASWLSDYRILDARDAMAANSTATGYLRGFRAFANEALGDSHGCLSPSIFHNMPALPPLPVLACAFGIMVHAPFSILYHYKYAHSLPPGSARTNHWSRRMDQAMIHVCSIFLSFATSGSKDFFLANLLFNLECVYRQFEHKVRPRRNKMRLMISIIAYTLPMLHGDHLDSFLRFWSIMIVAFWLFGAYPIGGWSHSVFHLVAAVAVPTILEVAVSLPASQSQLNVAAQCVVWQEGQ